MTAKDTFTAKELHQRMQERIAKHTPGPWTWNPKRHKVAQPNGDDVLVGPDYLANARLIAAAPELLEAADRLVRAYENECATAHDVEGDETCVACEVTRIIRRARGEE